jgi:hypothetical protein
MPQKPSGLGGLLPQQNLDFLNKLPQNMMPNLDFSNLPQNMRPGFVAGGPLSRAANLSTIYRKNATARGIPVPGNLQSIYSFSSFQIFKTRYREFNYGRNWSRSSSWT